MLAVPISALYPSYWSGRCRLCAFSEKNTYCQAPSTPQTKWTVLSQHIAIILVAADAPSLNDCLLPLRPVRRPENGTILSWQCARAVVFFFSPGWDLMTGGRPKAPDSFFVAENYRGVNAKFRLHVHLLGWNLFYLCSCSGFCSRMNAVDTCSSRRQNAHTPHSKTDWGFITNGLFLWIMFTESTNPNAELKLHENWNAGTLRYSSPFYS